MAPINEHRIISKAVTEEDIGPLLARGVTPDWFFNDEHRDALRYILKHHATYSRVPTRTTFQTHMGTTYRLFGVSESMEYLLDTQADALRHTVARAMLPEVEEALDARDTDGAIKVIAERYAKIESYLPVPSVLVDSMDDGQVADRWREYKEREAGGGVVGRTTGFPTIDKATLGLQPGHLVTVVAQPKVGKTTVCLAMANHLYVEHKAPILFITYEMGVTDMALRQDSLLAGVSLRNLQAGALSKIERRKYRKHLDLIEDDYHWPFHFVDASLGVTVGSVRAQIERLEPEAVFVDGIYMMIDEVSGEANTPQALTSITRSLKRLATQAKVPIVINTQALAWKSKGQRITGDSIGYSSSFLQDSDVVLGLERIQPQRGEDGSAYALSRTLKVLVSRHSGLASVEVTFDYNTGTVEEVTP